MFKVNNENSRTASLGGKFGPLFRQHIFGNIFLGLRCRIFLMEIIMLIFAELAIFHSI